MAPGWASETPLHHLVQPDVGRVQVEHLHTTHPFGRYQSQEQHLVNLVQRFKWRPRKALQHHGQERAPKAETPRRSLHVPFTNLHSRGCWLHFTLASYHCHKSNDDVVERPSQSPVFNQMENLWRDLKSRDGREALQIAGQQVKEGFHH